MPKRGKNWRAAAEKRDNEKTYTIAEAVKFMKESSKVKFDATTEVHFRLGIDPRHADQQIRSTVSLPNGTGKKVRIIVFCSDDRIAEAKKAGAMEAGAEDLIDKISKGWTDFDVAVATPDMMRNLAKVARVLGPRGLMPNPKAGTVTEDLLKAIGELAAGRIEFRNDKNGNVHTVFGKVSFDEAKLVENLEAMIKAIKDNKPNSQKGDYVRNISINATMSPGIRINVE